MKRPLSKDKLLVASGAAVVVLLWDNDGLMAIVHAVGSVVGVEFGGVRGRSSVWPRGLC